MDNISEKPFEKDLEFLSESESESDLDLGTDPENSSRLSPSSSNPPSVLAVKTVRSQNQRYWKLNFLVALFPLLFCGIPIHLLLAGRRGLTTTKGWLREIFLRDKIPVRILSFIFLIVGIGINGFAIYLTLVLVDSLVIQGKVRSSILEDLINILRLVPLLVPLDVIWIWGFSVRKLLLSFDRVTYPEIEVQFKEDKEKRKQKKWKAGWRNMPCYRIRLALIYFLVILNQGIRLIVVLKENCVEELEEARRVDNWISYGLHFMYNLMLPIYILLTWAIQFEFERLSLYIKALIRCKVHPDFGYLAEFKASYKAVANHVMLVNDICGIYYSWVFLVLFWSMYQEVYGVLQVIITSLINAALGEIGNGNQLPPGDVRLFMGFFFAALSQVLLLGLTVWFCITANDQARYLHVRLNDFVTEPYVTLSPELYKQFRMLKYYIHSRMETERPALLNIGIISSLPYCSKFYGWKMAYNVRH